MSWFSLKPAPEPEAPTFVAPNPEKINFNIDRFRRALEQCTSGDDRRDQLRANLRYWETLAELYTIERI